MEGIIMGVEVVSWGKNVLVSNFFIFTSIKDQNDGISGS